MEFSVFGTAVVFAVVVILGLAARRARGGARWGRLTDWVSRVRTPQPSEIVTVSVDAILDQAKTAGDDRIPPSCLSLTIPADDVLFVQAHEAAIKSSIVRTANQRGVVEARRAGLTWKALSQITFLDGFAVGELEAIASFGPLPTRAAEPTPRRTPVWTTSASAPAASFAGSAVGTRPPLDDEPGYVVELTVNGSPSSRLELHPGEELVVGRVGRLHLPELPGLSAEHLRVIAAERSLTLRDLSTYGSWISVGDGWVPLSSSSSTRATAPLTIALDRRHTVLVVITAITELW
jgi:hypothetical protein